MAYFPDETPGETPSPPGQKVVTCERSGCGGSFLIAEDAEPLRDDQGQALCPDCQDARKQHPPGPTHGTAVEPASEDASHSYPYSWFSWRDPNGF